MRSGFKPVHQASLIILDAVAVAWQWSIRYTLIDDQLHMLDSAAEMCVEISCNGGICNLVLLVRCVLGVGDV